MPNLLAASKGGIDLKVSGNFSMLLSLTSISGTAFTNLTVPKSTPSLKSLKRLKPHEFLPIIKLAICNN
jgi:hypothetical protein